MTTKTKLTENDLYYLRSIKRQMEAVKATLLPDSGFILGSIAFTDNLDWLDCFIEKHERQ